MSGASKAEWDSRWAAELARAAVYYVAEQAAKLSPEERERVDIGPFISSHEKRADEAAARRERDDYQAALREYARAGIEALRAARRYVA